MLIQKRAFLKLISLAHKHQPEVIVHLSIFLLHYSHSSNDLLIASEEQTFYYFAQSQKLIKIIRRRIDRIAATQIEHGVSVRCTQKKLGASPILSLSILWIQAFAIALPHPNVLY